MFRRIDVLVDSAVPGIVTLTSAYEIVWLYMECPTLVVFAHRIPIGR